MMEYFYVVIVNEFTSEGMKTRHYSFKTNVNGRAIIDVYEKDGKTKLIDLIRALVMLGYFQRSKHHVANAQEVMREIEDKVKNAEKIEIKLKEV